MDDLTFWVVILFILMLPVICGLIALVFISKFLGFLILVLDEYLHMIDWMNTFLRENHRVGVLSYRWRGSLSICGIIDVTFPLFLWKTLSSYLDFRCTSPNVIWKLDLVLVIFNFAWWNEKKPSPLSNIFVKISGMDVNNLYQYFTYYSYSKCFSW